MSLDIKFVPLTKEIELVVPQPKPAKEYTPKWFKDMELFIGGSKQYSDGKLANKTMKLCMPVADTFSTGYIQETHCDLFIEVDENDKMTCHYSTSPEVMTFRNNHPDGVMKTPQQFIDQECSWRQPWTPVLPKGYSMLITHPLNRMDLPFQTLSGIVDYDDFCVEIFPNNIPFYIYKGFSGLIPAGTPIFQMIPIKRDSWRSSVSEYDEVHARQSVHSFGRKFYGFYRDLYWKKKDYK